MYEEYMQNLLGKPVNPNQNMYDNNVPQNYQYGGYDFVRPVYQYRANDVGGWQNVSNEELEEMYPDIYRVIYPMIQKTCMRNTQPITEETLDEMTRQIYSNIEADNIINIDVTVDDSASQNNRGENNKNNEEIVKDNIKVNNRSSENISDNKKEVRGSEDRQFGNNSLRDLIRILLIRELIGRPGNWRPNPPRPMPPRPPRPNPPRPMPPRPRGYDYMSDSDIYYNQCL